MQRVCLSLPDAFVSPTTWVTHSSLLVSILSDDIGDNCAPGDQRHREIHRILLDNSSDIQRRNDAMLFCNLPPRVLERLGSMVVDIQVGLFIHFLNTSIPHSIVPRPSTPSLARPTCPRSVSSNAIQLTVHLLASPRNLISSLPGRSRRFNSDPIDPLPPALSSCTIGSTRHVVSCLVPLCKIIYSTGWTPMKLQLTGQISDLLHLSLENSSRMACLTMQLTSKGWLHEANLVYHVLK
jgi:hypothetical protein